MLVQDKEVQDTSMHDPPFPSGKVGRETVEAAMRTSQQTQQEQI